MGAALKQDVGQLSKGSDLPKNVSPLSREIVVGFVGYAGAGCSTAARRLRVLLEHYNYDVRVVKFSDLIVSRTGAGNLPAVLEGVAEGKSKLTRAIYLQDRGDELRGEFGSHAIASLAMKKIKELRGSESVGEKKVAYILDSIKHKEEVDLLRRVYDLSFRLIAVHCERDRREDRLIGDDLSSAKFKNVPHEEVLRFIERDEKDVGHDYGQGVRDAFYLADFFLENNITTIDGTNMNADIERFVKLLLGSDVVRPALDERAMYHAHAAALQSACLSRQVGAVLVSASGEIVSTGTNEVPTFNGGVYSEESSEDHRCHAWEFVDGDLKFTGCHNDRKKEGLRNSIARWIAQNFSSDLAEAAHPLPIGGMDAGAKAREAAKVAIEKLIIENTQKFSGLPGVKEIIEYSRAIHAEMGAVISAARSGVSPVGSTLYCTTYPCHNCARHLVTAGVHKVLYIEPYVKSLASELHSDAITSDPPVKGGAPSKMAVVPFTGVGPRMYEDFFVKRGNLKRANGTYSPPTADAPAYAVRVRELLQVEDAAAALVPDIANA